MKKILIAALAISTLGIFNQTSACELHHKYWEVALAGGAGTGLPGLNNSNSPLFKGFMGNLQVTYNSQLLYRNLGFFGRSHLLFPAANKQEYIFEVGPRYQLFILDSFKIFAEVGLGTTIRSATIGNVTNPVVDFGFSFTPDIGIDYELTDWMALQAKVGLTNLSVGWGSVGLAARF